MPVLSASNILLLLLIEILNPSDAFSLPISRLEVGPHTTVLKGSLAPDGRFDFEAAYNAQASVGVTVENNAAVLLIRAFGNTDLPADLRPRFYRYLGIEELPEVGNYILTKKAYVEQLTAQRSLRPTQAQIIQDDLDQVPYSLWKREDLPDVAAWLDANQKSLELLEQASQRPKFYLPLVSNVSMINPSLPLVRLSRDATQLLLTRAMLRIAEGQIDEATQDLVTCHRLAVFIGQIPIHLCELVGSALEASVFQGVQILLAQRLTLEQIHGIQEHFSSLPPLTDISRSIDLGDRCAMLDGLQRQWMEHLSSKIPGSRYRWTLYDINLAMKDANQYLDALLAQHDKPNRSDRYSAIKGFQDEMGRQWADVKKPKTIKAFRRRLGPILVLLIAPNVSLIQNVEDRSEMLRDLLKLSFALAAYRVKNDGYPENLEALKPEFLTDIPVDYFSGQPLHYKRHRTVYQLYSVDRDGKDDQGRHFNEDGGDLPLDCNERERMLYEPAEKRTGRIIKERQREDFNFALRALGVVAFILTVVVARRAYVLSWIPKLKIGPDTSIVTCPLRTDGTVDFEAAIHERLSAGVTYENNAAVLLQHLIGPTRLAPEVRRRYDRYLGFPTEAPETVPHGPTLVNEQSHITGIVNEFESTAELAQNLECELSQGVNSPWSRLALPHLAGWLEVNRDPLNLIAQASLKPRFYTPLVNDGPLWDAVPLRLEIIGTAVKAFVSRVMLRIAEGDLDGAINDQLTCHRLSSLMAHSSTAAGLLISLSIDEVATYCGQSLLSQPLTIEHIQRYQAGLAALPVTPPFTDMLDQITRLVMLDGLQAAAHSLEIRGQLLTFTRFSKFDLNVAFRQSNRWFDILKSILQIPSLNERHGKMKAWEIESVRRDRKSADRLLFLRRLIWTSRKVRSQAIADIILRQMLPEVRQLQQEQDRATLRRELLTIALAIAVYQSEHGDSLYELHALNLSLSDPLLAGRESVNVNYERQSNGYTLTVAGPGETSGEHVSFNVQHSPTRWNVSRPAI